MDIQTCLARCRFSHHLNFTLGSGVNLKKKKHFCNAESNWTSLLRNCFPGIINRISYIHDLYSGRMDQNGKLAACMLLIIKCCYSCEKYNKDIINSLSAKKKIYYVCVHAGLNIYLDTLAVFLLVTILLSTC